MTQSRETPTVQSDKPQSGVAQPAASQPAASPPAASPSAPSPSAPSPSATSPSAASQPAASQSAASQSAASQSAASQSAASQSAASPPAASPSAPSQPATPKTEAPKAQDTRAGFFFALGAYLLWGFLPIYMKALAHVPPPEVIAHRVLWSLPIALAVVVWSGRWPAMVAVLRSPKLVLALACSALISVNWGLYVWAIGSGHALDAALGYYINPLFSIFLGAVLLRERLNTRQKAAIALAAAAVAVLTFEAGRLPLVALGLTLTWGFYAYLKRRMPIGPNEGFALEVLILSPFALAYAVYLSASGQAVFLTETPTTVLLLCAGIVTAIPLMLYANGAKGLSLSTIGIMQYISPTMILMLATLAFGEHLGRAQMLAFPMIWAALALYSANFVAALWRR